jgi:hypothetical protein
MRVRLGLLAWGTAFALGLCIPLAGCGESGERCPEPTWADSQWCDGDVLMKCRVDSDETYAFVSERCREQGGVCVALPDDGGPTEAACVFEGESCEGSAICRDEALHSCVDRQVLTHGFDCAAGEDTTTCVQRDGVAQCE